MEMVAEAKMLIVHQVCERCGEGIMQLAAGYLIRHLSLVSFIKAYFTDFAAIGVFYPKWLIISKKP